MSCGTETRPLPLVGQIHTFTTCYFGGAGLGAMERAVVLEEIVAVDGATALIIASYNALCAGHLYCFGDTPQRGNILSRSPGEGEVLGAAWP